MVHILLEYVDLGIHAPAGKGYLVVGSRNHAKVGYDPSLWDGFFALERWRQQPKGVAVGLATLVTKTGKRRRDPLALNRALQRMKTIHGSSSTALAGCRCIRWDTCSLMHAVGTCRWHSPRRDLHYMRPCRCRPHTCPDPCSPCLRHRRPQGSLGKGK